MMFIIGYLLLSVVIITIAFFLVEKSPSGYEDENGFHINSKPAPQINSDWVRSNRLRAGNAYRHAASLAE